MISSSINYSFFPWTPSLIDEYPPNTVRIQPRFGVQGTERVVAGFGAMSGVGRIFDFSIWSRNGKVLVPATTERDEDPQIGPNQSEILISTIPQLGIHYEKPHFDLMRSWLETCRDHHETCNKSAALVEDDEKRTVLPTRLIDISRMAEGLVILADTKGQRGNYSALSYCWGERPEENIKTTKDKLFEHQTAIRTETLSRVFKDAIKTTNEVGLHYLWIDSLCIIQDDEDDWTAEAKLMSEVYRNADLIIAAAGASEPSEGCFIERTMPPYPERRVSIVPSADGLNGVKSIWIQQEASVSQPADGPLQKRGWTLQEIYLARRSLHFMSSGMFWQCQELKTNERRFDNAVLERQGWLSLLHSFSQRQLTRKSDRLFAIQGLVNDLLKDFGPDFHYQKGIFNRWVIEQILWSMAKVSPYEKPDEVHVWEEVPSWSWAYKNGKKRFWWCPELERCLQEDGSDVELTLTSDDIILSRGYSANCYVADAVDRDAVLNDPYEKAMIDTVAGWRVKELYTMTPSNGLSAKTVGFAAPDTVLPSTVIILFIAERKWTSVEEERDNG
ncbi:hypothetical protein FGRMN_5732 [Fusarium graminum]|nr:hypothetical protein FGRMN_5732 [Fusarium graminum]